MNLKQQWQIINLMMRAEQAKFNEAVQQSDDYVGLFPEPRMDIPKGVLAQSQQNYNIDLLGVDNFIKDIVVPRGGKMRKVKIFIFDTGARYRSKYLPEEYLDYSLSTNGYPNEGDFDEHSHSSFIAGLLCGVVDAFRLGMLVHEDLPEGWVELTPIKLMNKNGSGSTRIIKQEIRKLIAAYDSGKIDKEAALITNHSYGGFFQDVEMEDLFDELEDRGFVNIASAGNSGNGGEDVNRVGSPGRFLSTLAIAATDRNKRVASFSSQSDEKSLSVDFTAGGVALTSINQTEDGFQVSSGTSFSGPCVAGAVALILGAFPEIELGSAETRNQVEAYLKAFITDLGKPNRDRAYGEGLPDLTLYDEAPDGSIPDDPDEPGDEPDEPKEPVRKERTIKGIEQRSNTLMLWRRLSEKALKPVNIREWRYTLDSTRPTDVALLELDEAVKDYFKNRAIVVPDDWDYDKVVLWTAGFMERILNGKQGFKFYVTYIEGMGLDLPRVYFSESDIQKIRINSKVLGLPCELIDRN